MVLNAPNVYIEEESSLSAPVVSNATTVAAFVGYTETGTANEPTRITSLFEYEDQFGSAEITDFSVTIDTQSGDEVSYKLAAEPVLTSNLYHDVRMFFANGGGECVIVSVGSHSDTLSYATLKSGLDLLEDEDDIDLLLPGDASQLSANDYHQYCQDMLAQCASKADRFAIFNVLTTDTAGTETDDFKNNIGDENLSYGAAYWPYLNTTLAYDYSDNSVNVTIDDATTVTLGTVSENLYINKVIELLDEQTVILPPSAAVAGVYARVDHNTGVWKSPANQSLLQVDDPFIKLNDSEQADLNVDSVTGKSINVIRTFNVTGPVVWGARTLDGNDTDFKYISTRRLLIDIESNVADITSTALGEPHISRLWQSVITQLESYLDRLWRSGALAGASASEAYMVKVYLDETMTEDDITNGILNITVAVAVLRPAEFITVTFTRKL